MGAIDLKGLYVLRDYHQRGLGGMLVAWGCEKADEMGLRAYCESEDLPLYLREGFVEVDHVTVDLQPWSGKKGDLYRRSLMIRDCKSGPLI